MGRIRNGFRLLAASARVVRQEPGLLAVMGVGIVLQIGIFAGMFSAIYGRSPQPADFEFPRFLWAFPILATSGIVGSITAATVIATAMQRLEGRDARLKDGFALAMQKFPKLVVWNFVLSIVMLVFQVIAERLKLGGRLAAAIGGVAWAVATMLVVPVLLFEPVGVWDSVKRSARLIRERWGEGVTGVGGMAAAMAVIIVPIVILGGVAGAMFDPVAAVVVTAGLMFALILVLGTLSGVFTAALYRFAVEGTPGSTFTKAQLEGAFSTRAEERRGAMRRAMRIGGVILGLLYLVMMIAQWVLRD